MGFIITWLPVTLPIAVGVVLTMSLMQAFKLVRLALALGVVSIMTLAIWGYSEWYECLETTRFVSETQVDFTCSGPQRWFAASLLLAGVPIAALVIAFKTNRVYRHLRNAKLEA